MSEEARKHTGLLTMDRNSQEAAFSVTRIVHSPKASRPLGVQLPSATTICGCNWDPIEGSWIFIKENLLAGESLFRYRSSCCGVVLLAAIFPGRRRSIVRNGTLFVEEDWNSEIRSFDFKESTMVRMKVYVSTKLLLFSLTRSSHDLSSHQQEMVKIEGKEKAKWIPSRAPGPLLEKQWHARRLPRALGRILMHNLVV